MIFLISTSKIEPLPFGVQIESFTTLLRGIKHFCPKFETNYKNDNVNFSPRFFGIFSKNAIFSVFLSFLALQINFTKPLGVIFHEESNEPTFVPWKEQETRENGIFRIIMKNRVYWKTRIFSEFLVNAKNVPREKLGERRGF